VAEGPWAAGGLPAEALDLAAAGFSALAEEAGAVGVIPAPPLAALREKLAEHVFNLVVAGEFKRGKSSVINGLLGAELLPTGVVPLTSVVTRLHYGEAAGATVTFENGAVQPVPIAELPDYVTERGNPKNQKGVRDVAVTFPAAWLKGGIRLVDTPGIGSVHAHNTEVTYQYLPQADAVIFVASVDQPVSRTELDFLGEIRRYAGKVFCLLNKVDHLRPAELAESAAFTTATLHQALGAQVPVFPVSARLALEGREADAPALLERSGFPEFDATLRRFLLEDGGAVWLGSVRAHLLRLLSEGRLACELELRALALPLELLDSKLQAFAAKKEETLQAKSDFDALLQADARRLVKDRIEPDLAAFKRALLPRLTAAVDRWYEELRLQRPEALHRGLEQRLIREVRDAYEGWRAEEDAAVAAAFEQLCGRFWSRIQQSLDELLRYSAELFDIPFSAIDTGALWSDSKGFYYKFWQEVSGLMLMTNSLVLRLPARIAHPLILRQARKRAAELAEVQSGRLRYDFEERIKRSVQQFRKEMLDRIEATSTGIEIAIDKGRALRMRGEDAAAGRRAELEAALGQIASLEERCTGAAGYPK
jgi:GTP-binding protein EngB required for normal cell division